MLKSDKQIRRYVCLDALRSSVVTYLLTVKHLVEVEKVALFTDKECRVAFENHISVFAGRPMCRMLLDDVEDRRLAPEIGKAVADKEPV